MATIETCYEHIAINENGVPYISGTTMKVIELVGEMFAYGWSAEELLFQHSYLTLGQIHAALAYYWDHAEELDKDMAARKLKVKELQKKTPVSPLVARLRAQGLI
ncbi:MAG: DUF433 domain-containing protein [bacterium]